MYSLDAGHSSTTITGQVMVPSLGDENYSVFGSQWHYKGNPTCVFADLNDEKAVILLLNSFREILNRALALFFNFSFYLLLI